MTILSQEADYNLLARAESVRSRSDMRPVLLITLGDVAGVGPEIVVRAWSDAELHRISRPVVAGDAGHLLRARQLVGSTARLAQLEHPEQADPAPDCIPFLQATEQDLSGVAYGQVSAAAGQAACDFLCRAIDLARAGRAHGIVTAPLHKEGLAAAGLSYPGHTEILAERTGVRRYAMMLYLARPGGAGLGVVHVTLHLALREVFARLSQAGVLEKIELAHQGLARLHGRPPRLGVCGLNPHASDGGLFGDEEQTILAPAVAEARNKGLSVEGPIPADTLFLRAWDGSEFDGVVAMYHDQGHIPIKLLGRRRAVNVTLGLPIIRTSVAHGTAYDIAGKGIADASSLLEAVRVAVRMGAV